MNKKEQLMGDYTSEKMKELRLDRLAKKLSELTGTPCGCEKRKEQLNNIHERFKNARSKN